MDLTMDLLIVVQLVEDVLQCSPSLFWDVLDILDLVLQRLTVGLWPRCTTSRLTSSPVLHSSILFLSHGHLPLLHHLILNIRIEAKLVYAVCGRFEATLTTVHHHHAALVHLKLLRLAPISHALLRISALRLILEMSSVELSNDIGFIVLELPAQVFDSLVLIGTATIVGFEVAAETCRHQQARYLFWLGR